MPLLRAWVGVALVLAAPRAAEAWCGMSGDVEIAPNGGLFASFWKDDLALRSGKRVIRLRRVERAGPGLGFVQLYRPARPLEPGRAYQVIDRSGWCEDRVGPGPVARAARAADVTPPVWTGPARIFSTSFASCGGHHGRVIFEFPVTDDSDIALTVGLRGDRERGAPHRDLYPLVDGKVTVHVGGSIAGYQATFCAEDAAGNVSCAERSISLLSPNRGPRVYLVEWDEDLAMSVVGAPPPPDERLRATRVRGEEVDWPRVATTGGALSVFFCTGLALGLARAGRRRGARISS